jgi:spermidine synthase
MEFLSQLGLSFGLTLSPFELIFGLLIGGAAMWVGAVLAKRQARRYATAPTNSSGTSVTAHGNFPAVNFFDYGDMRFLHLGSPAVQGSMKISQPLEIHLEYVQRMMGWLLFTNFNELPHLHAMQLGLGAASLTKFCHHKLNMHTTAIELNPQVVETCRRWFNLPQDNSKLEVIVGDAAEVITQARWVQKIDVLQVDLYDQEAARPVHDSEAFYRDCRNLLNDNGCMTVNLFGHASSYHESLRKIASVFADGEIWAFKPTKAGNTVVMAFRTPRQSGRDALELQAAHIQAHWSLPAKKWLKTLHPTAS